MRQHVKGVTGVEELVHDVGLRGGDDEHRDVHQCAAAERGGGHRAHAVGEGVRPAEPVGWGVGHQESGLVRGGNRTGAWGSDGQVVHIGRWVVAGDVDDVVGRVFDHCLVPWEHSDTDEDGDLAYGAVARRSRCADGVEIGIVTVETDVGQVGDVTLTIVEGDDTVGRVMHNLDRRGHTRARVGCQHVGGDREVRASAAGVVGHGDQHDASDHAGGKVVRVTRNKDGVGEGLHTRKAVGRASERDVLHKAVTAISHH